MRSSSTGMHRCPVRHCDGDDGEPTMTSYAVCDGHRRRLYTNLAELPRYYVMLSMAMVPSSSAGGEHVTVTKSPPLPLNITMRSIQEDMLRVVHDAEVAHRRARQFTAVPLRGREGSRLVGGVVFLRRHLDRVICESYGVELALGVFAVVAATRSALQLDRLVHRLPAPCPSCDTLGLERESGADRVVCCYCDRTFSEPEYTRLVLILASDLL